MKNYFMTLIVSEGFKVFALSLFVVSMLVGMIILDKAPSDKGNKLSETDVGEVLDVTVAFDSFGEPATVRVETNKVVVFVKGIVSVTRREKAQMPVIPANPMPE